jgi:hypothetical protein
VNATFNDGPTLQPALDKSNYKEGLMELKAPQDGIIKDLAVRSNN